MGGERLFVNGKPNFWLENQEKNSPEVRRAYGDYAEKVVKFIGEKELGFPKDIVVIGANWSLVVEGGSGSGLHKITWPIENRAVPRPDNTGPIAKIDVVLDEIIEGVNKAKFSTRIGKKVAILDVAGLGFPLYEESGVTLIEKKWWGRIIKHPQFPTFVYHITDLERYNPLQDLEKENRDEKGFIAGQPPIWLDHPERLQVKTGVFGLAVLNELREKDREIPFGAIIAGDNWFQVVHGSRNAQTEKEKEYLEKNPTGLIGRINQLEERVVEEKVDMFPEIFTKVWMDVVLENIQDQNILDRITVVDRTSVGYPLFDESEIEVIKDTDWGRIIKIKGWGVYVYHVTRGYNTRFETDSF